MLDPTIVTKYSGPPGTGKSTTLLNAVDSYLSSGVAPEDIVFTTFTRAGADEARNRACLRFNLPPNRFPYFRTLHSICFSLLPKHEVMRWNDWFEVGRMLGVSFSTKLSPEEPVPRGHTKGDFLLSLWSLSRVMRKSPEETFKNRYKWLLGQDSMDFREFEHFIDAVTRYKESCGRIDFTDMLEQYLAHGPLIRPHVAIIDETQDLSLIQWEVVDKLCIGASAVLVAGDDDQCIHEWNGAFPSAFIDLPSTTYSVLPQSYRIPASVHRLAEGIIGRVQHRLPKVYQPRPDEGKVEYIDDEHLLDLSKGSWLLLARNISFLQRYVTLCREFGYLWTSSSVPCIDPNILTAVRAWKKLAKGTINGTEAQAMYKYLSSGDRIARGFKKKMEGASREEQFDFEKLFKEYGLVAFKDMPWDMALDVIGPADLSFLRAAETKESLDQPPRIDISTIHGAKGREADHVAIISDMSYRTNEAFQTNQDAEHRVWYVGVTRARHSLHILAPTTDKSYPL